MPARASAAASRSRVRAANPRPAAGAGRQHVGHRRLLDQTALGDDHDVVGELRHLGENVARDEHRAPLARERAEEVAQPADALRIEPVRRLVEHEHLRAPRAARRRARGAASSRASNPSCAGSPPRSGRRARAPRRPARRRCPTRPPRSLGRWLRPRAARVRTRSPRGSHQPCEPERVELGIVTPEDRRVAARRVEQRHERAQRRRLARPVRAEEAGDASAARRGSESSSTARTDAVPLREVRDLDQSSYRASRRPSARAGRRTRRGRSPARCRARAGRHGPARARRSP